MSLHGVGIFISLSLFFPGLSLLSDRDAERRASEVEASFSKQLRAAQERERAAGLSMERRLREEGELAQRLSSRNSDLEVRKMPTIATLKIAGPGSLVGAR